MARWPTHAASLANAVDHFASVTRSSWSGLFHGYDVSDLPRANSEPEQFFGAFRYQERRATGRKAAAQSLVVRGPARLLAAAYLADLENRLFKLTLPA